MAKKVPWWSQLTARAWGLQLAPGVCKIIGRCRWHWNWLLSPAFWIKTVNEDKISHLFSWQKILAKHCFADKLQNPENTLIIHQNNIKNPNIVLFGNPWRYLFLRSCLSATKRNVTFFWTAPCLKQKWATMKKRKKKNTKSLAYLINPLFP